MRATVQICTIAFFAGVLLGAASGCATSIEVRVDDNADFSKYRTWGWRMPSALVDEKALPLAEVALARAVANEIRLAMRDRGFEYAGPNADLLLTPELRILRKEVVVYRGESSQFLPSLHASPSYTIEGVTTEDVMIVDVTELEIVIVDRLDGRTVWAGTLAGRFKGAFAPHLEESVAQLMQSFPMAPSLDYSLDPGAVAAVPTKTIDPNR